MTNEFSDENDENDEDDETFETIVDGEPDADPTDAAWLPT